MEDRQNQLLKNVKTDTWQDFKKLKYKLKIGFLPEVLEYLVNKELKAIEKKENKNKNK